MKRTMTFDERELDMIEKALYEQLNNICKVIVDLEQANEQLRDMYEHGEIGEYDLVVAGCRKRMFSEQNIYKVMRPIANLFVTIQNERKGTSE